MFKFFKKPERKSSQEVYVLSFVEKIFQSVDMPDQNKRLARYIEIIESIRELEEKFDCKCPEQEIDRDLIYDAFSNCDDPGVLFASALSYGLFSKNIESISRIYLGSLPDHLKVRLLRTHILFELDGENVDPREFEPDLQHAFFEVEKRGLDELEAERVLSREFGIVGWRSRRFMNPNTIYD